MVKVKKNEVVFDFFGGWEYVLLLESILYVWLKEKYQLYIDGEFIVLVLKKYFLMINLVIEEVLVEVVWVNEKDVEKVVKVVWVVFGLWL